MVDEGYLLSKDVATVMEHAGQLYEAFAGRVREVQAADN